MGCTERLQANQTAHKLFDFYAQELELIFSGNSLVNTSGWERRPRQTKTSIPHPTAPELQPSNAPSFSLEKSSMG
jgi:hypothetical protein